MLRSLLVHPRTPGEKHTIGQLAEGWGGPPPYAGRKGGPHPAEFTTYRSTPVRRGKGERLSSGRPSTPATPVRRGKRTTSLRRGEPTAVHPRTPGEKAVIPRALWDSVGPPPHAGGKRLQGRSLRCKSRSTLARRGKT